MTIDLPDNSTSAPSAPHLPAGVTVPVSKACPRCGKPLAEHDIEITATRAQVNCRASGDFPFEI